MKLIDMVDDPVSHFDKIMDARRDQLKKEKDIDSMKLRKMK